MATEVLEADDKVNNGLLIKLSNGIELTNDFALRNTSMKKAKEHSGKRIESCDDYHVELRVPPRCVSVESKPKLRDFGHIGLGFR